MTIRRNRWIVPTLFTMVAGALVLPPQAQGQGRSKPDAPIRLYVFDMGTLKSANPKALLDRGITTTDMSVTAYLVVHPQGLLLFDTGVIPDDQIKPEGTTVARATAHKTLVAQMAEIGYKPSDITYLALSHGHYDHTANANEFAGATWIAQKAEREVMFGETAPPRTYAPATFSALKDSKTKLVQGDYDVFGDGTVMLVLTPGHTPGHQCLYVKLAKTGPVVLTGDLYHYPVERTSNDFNPYGGTVAEEEVASRSKLEAFLTEKGATLWMGHDIIQTATLRKSPAYYE
jgi:N-acyl homoserine lactone hydrolase